MSTVKDIPMDKIVIGPSQARVRQIDEDIDELATSMEKLGLLEPVVVYPTGDGSFELLTGQRRFLAAQKLNWKEIAATVVKKPENEAVAKAISLTENFVRKPLPVRDMIDACTALFKHYGSMKAVAEETGLPYHKVREYVKFDRLAPTLRKMVEENKIDMPIALKAQNAAEKQDGTLDEEKAVKFAETLKTMTGAHRKNLETLAEATPEKSADEIIEEARKPPQQETLRISLLQPAVQSLSKFASDEKTSKEDAAADLIVSGLKDKGY
ncbi:MAG: ParB/RepB/Spo0J family partition protein [Terriglobales bacterium]|jgi:ParB family chromosome partitioning protein